MCLLAPPGTCSVTFSAPAGSFMLEKYGNIDEVPYNMSGMSSLYCVRDYLRIPDGSADGGAHTSSHDRYCGGHLASTHGAAAPSPVTSRVISKIVAVEFHAGIPHKFMAISHGPGFRVAYQHNHCAATDTFNQVKIQDSRRSRPSLVLPPPPILKVGGGHRQSYYRTRHHKVSAPPDLHGESPSTLVPQPSILATLMQSDGAGGDVEATAAEGVLDPGWSPHSIYRKRGPGHDSNPEASLPSYASRPSYSANASSRPRRPPPTLPAPYWMTSAEEIPQATRLPSLPSLPAHPTPSKPILDNAQDTLGHPQDMINHQPQDFFGGP
ncbi:uncharacterized protein LOC119594651 [Penaeus monodon]|uniref:uncharacterized protein LOC119594651 n=1 Tax=Penaeus monodon TaxID=6687 RepID=UPI0018A72F99|nr:uncharacterized protein LOC119594651 [Penaeus monodon]